MAIIPAIVTFGVILLAVPDGIGAAILGALVAGIFSIINTVLNGRMLRAQSVNATVLAKTLEECQKLIVLLNQRRVTVRDPENDRNIVAYEPQFPEHESPPDSAK